MYRHCVYCTADLGTNEAIEEFRVGRRLAYDLDRGRLWVVCRRCERWNLSPLDERWEALEALERAYRETRRRVSSENIGLARLAEGLELVRVGRPRRPEFAAWRYGDQFGRRRRKFMAGAAITGGVALGLGLGSLAVAGASAALLPLHLLNLGRTVIDRRTPGVRLSAPDVGQITIAKDEVGLQRIKPSGEHESGWVLDLGRPWHPGAPTELAGPAAVHALSLILPKVNAAGAGPSQVRDAVRLIEEAGSPETFLPAVEYQARSIGRGYSPIRRLPRELRLAIEMAAHEDAERTALEGELALLEAAWREAEALAAIADDLVLPASVLDRLDAIRGRRPR